MTMGLGAKARIDAIRDLGTRTPRRFEPPKDDHGKRLSISQFFGVNTFGLHKMREKISKEAYAKLLSTIDKGHGWLEFDLSGNEIKIPEAGLIVAAEYFDTGKKNWNSINVNYKDSAGNKKKIIEKWYGGNFAMNDEINQGVTLLRIHGNWIIEKYSGIKENCTNLVVQIWVKY